MDCIDDLVITGEYWFYKKPSPYPLQYFEFIPAEGGFGSDSPSLEFKLYTPEASNLLDSVLVVKQKYPHSNLSIKRSELLAVQLRIYGYELYDFDINFALEIENFVSALKRRDMIGRFVEPSFWGELEYHRSEVTRVSGSFDERGISWVSSLPDENSGLTQRRISIATHHKGESEDQAFFDSLVDLLDRKNLESLEYKELDKNYMIFVGNGRQGFSGAEIVFSDIAGFKNELVELINVYNFELGHDPEWTGYDVGLSNYFALVNQEFIVVKDERNR